jgi:hypothetical protein
VRKLAVALAAGLGLAALAAPAGARTADSGSSIALSFAGRYAGAGAEIVDVDERSRRVVVVNPAAVDVLDLDRLLANDPDPRLFSIPVTGANSVAIDRGVIALAVEAVPKTEPGTVRFYDLDGQFLNQVTVGALPDMLTFTPGGLFLLVANEGEPASYTPQVDPAGSVSVIAMWRGARDVRQSDVRTAGFDAWIGREDDLRTAGVRIFGPGANAAQDLEPEYIATDRLGLRAWVTLQENNAIATIDVARARVVAIEPLGLKDHGTPGNGLNPSDQDGGSFAVGLWPVRGLYQPDGIDSFSWGPLTFLVTANEGDTRSDWPPFDERSRIGSLALDGTAFPNAGPPGLKSNDQLGRLRVTRTLGDLGGDGDYEELHAFGARSFSIWTNRGTLVWDSGDQFERVLGPLGLLNDARSSEKGPEPEGIEIGRVGGRTYAFVGLERTVAAVILVYDVTSPWSPRLVQVVVGDGDVSPEGLHFVPGGRQHDALLLVAHEVSNTTTAYRIEVAD